MTDGLFTEIDAPDADGDELEGSAAFTEQQYATLERLTQLKAMLAVNQARVEQVTKWNHTDESDANEPIWWHAKKANERIHDVLEILRSDRPDRLGTAYTKLVKGLALGLTALDRIDAVMARRCADEELNNSTKETT